MNRRSTLVILLATCERTLEAFEERDDPVDPELVADLERVVERTRRELAALRPRTAHASK
ncbi:MAG TPA: hypothetical protein VG079_05890 [Gaiellaceae bacterium]|nr:hypothetical protein [Gaiellaceae bacterium]